MAAGFFIAMHLKEAGGGRFCRYYATKISVMRHRNCEGESDMVFYFPKAGKNLPGLKGEENGKINGGQKSGKKI
ncbi:MAG: hypothetical protein NC307_09055 [Roseburia sp.]|nr:hypothetical protein [Roseburia sp.]